MRLFSSESVTMGHPDKICDQISDGILDAYIEKDPYCRVACETLVKTGLVVVAGEITSSAFVDIPKVVRDTIREIGYTDSTIGFDADSCGIILSLTQQAADIDQGVSTGKGLHKEQGAGDQGLMFGYACNETEEMLPLPIALANRLVRSLTEARTTGALPFLRPDGKTQVTVEYEGDTPVRVHTVVLSTQHTPEVEHAELSERIIEKVIRPVLPPPLVKGDIIFHINPTGRFVLGGPHADCGLTGRKIIVDTYGGRGCHGGGAFSGKDPSKVDRSASYYVRYAAKNVIAAGLADRCEIQVAYAIGVADPVSIHVDTQGTGTVEEEKIEKALREVFDFKPGAMIEALDLRRPIFKETARYGHFGRPTYRWEQTDKAEALKQAAGA
jgi:S-adenosylmethionine synthetase